mmetsp:Transcript_18857/g.23988  ORF Transcript_18857/g.23988 Transcript_18857/m.23988 type:complete len:467 (-) Transcript_18857:30-1430(-)
MSFVNFVKVPEALLHWVNSNEAKDIFEETRAKTGAVSISLASTTLETTKTRVVQLKVVTSSETSQRAVKSLLELHLKNQKEISGRGFINSDSNSHQCPSHMHGHSDAHNENPAPTLSSVDSKSVAFIVDESVCGYMIGQKGNNIRKVEKKLGVQISVNSQGSDKRVVTIFGPDAQTVQQARELVEFEEVFVPVLEAHLRVVEDAKAHKFAEWRNQSGCTRMEYEKVNENQRQTKNIRRNMEGIIASGFVRIVGTKPAVKLARDLLEAQLDYEVKFLRLGGEFPKQTKEPAETSSMKSQNHSKLRKPKLKKKTNDDTAQILNETGQVETPLYQLWLQQQGTKHSDSDLVGDKNKNSDKQHEKKQKSKGKPQKRKDKQSDTAPTRKSNANRQERKTITGGSNSKQKHVSDNKRRTGEKSKRKVIETPLSRVSYSSDTQQCKDRSSLDVLLLNGTLSVDEYAARLVQQE